MFGFVRLIRNHSLFIVSDQPGMTWLELMLLSLGHLDNPLEFAFPHTSFTRPTVASTLNDFRARAHALLQFAVDESAKSAFARSYAEPSRVLHLGISSRLLHTSCIIFIRPSLIPYLSSCILSLVSDIPQHKIDGYLARVNRITLAPVDGARPIAGRRYVASIHAHIARHYHLLPTDFASLAPPSSFACPAGHSRAACSSFNPFMIHKSIWCSQCAKPFRSKLWQCECGKSCHSCTTHATIDH